jgi:hypothetical protein
MKGLYQTLREFWQTETVRNIFIGDEQVGFQSSFECMILVWRGHDPELSTYIHDTHNSPQKAISVGYVVGALKSSVLFLVSFKFESTVGLTIGLSETLNY